MLFACHTYYSLKYGTSKVETLVEKSKELGIESLVLTDINNTTATYDFIRECSSHHIKAVIGVEIRNGDTFLYSLLAKNDKGYAEINSFISKHNLEKIDYPETAPKFKNVYVIYPLSALGSDLSDDEFIGVHPYELSLIYNRVENGQKDKLLAFYPVTFCNTEEFELHIHLRAIDHNVILSKLKANQTARKDELLISPTVLQSMYEDYPYLLKNAQRLIDSCSFEFDFRIKKNKQVFTTSREEDRLLLEELAFDGMKYRYGTDNAFAKKRIREELKVINELGIAAYFLITWDIITYTSSKGMYHIGRGSGGNSIVAYCLKITDIDPIELNLYFERFINPHRTSPPDFDIDYSWKDRDAVYEYIFSKYGNHAALLGTINSFKDSSVLRELGKVYGLPKAEIDKLTEQPDDPALRNNIVNKIFEIGEQIMNFPRIRSIHAGGILISDQPIVQYAALDLPPKGLPVVQIDMYIAEEIGLDKLDILSQRGLGHINDCVEIVKENTGTEIDIHQVNKFKTDPKINEQLYNGEAIGCFYVESPAMRGLFKKLRCKDYTTLVAASSIIRPGVAKSGMMREYIKRFHNRNTIKYLSPEFEEHLGETFGVMVYQEDVIKIAHHFGGLSLTDADTLRRAMSGKYRSRKAFDQLTKKFFSNCEEKGHSLALTKEVWRQMSSFAGYAFCKAHSASYAIESYQSLYLKTYFPKEFYTAVINNFGGFYRTWVYINEAKRHGANILLPDINRSRQLTSLHGNDMYLGWVHVKSLESSTVERFMEERSVNGDFKGFQDFLERVHIGQEQLQILIRIGAFRTMGDKMQLMWDRLLLAKADVTVNSKPMFREPKRKFELPTLNTSKLEDAFDEMELIGFPVTLSRFDMLQTPYRGNTFAKDLSSRIGKTVRMVGDLVTRKNVFTSRREWMHFGCFLDKDGNFFDTVNFPNSVKKYPFTGSGVYLIQGKVVEEFGFPSVDVEKMARLPFQTDPRVE